MSSGGLSTAIADLQQRVAALEAQSGGGEELTANYLTLTPGGLVGADFTGTINALGLILPAALADGSPGASNQIVWNRQADGATVANIYGVGPTGTGQAYLYSQTQSPASSANTQVEQYADSGASTGLIRLTAVGDSSAAHQSWLQINGNDAGVTDIEGDVGGVLFKLMDGAGASSFIQTTGGYPGARIGLQSGVQTFGAIPLGWQPVGPVNFPTPFTAVPAVAYSLQPGSALASIISTELRGPPTVNSFTVDVDNNAAQVITVYWIAIGAF